MTDAFENLTQLLSEMQREHIRRAWSEDVFKRIEQADAFRGKLFDAIQEFASHSVKRGF